MTDLDIGEYALLSDCHSAALVSRHGSVDWLCLPRFDAPSVFGRLLDRDAGHWTIRPHEDFEVARHYLEHTMVLETQFTTATGVVILTDALVFDDNAPGTRPAATHLTSSPEQSRSLKGPSCSTRSCARDLSMAGCSRASSSRDGVTRARAARPC